MRVVLALGLLAMGCPRRPGATHPTPSTTASSSSGSPVAAASSDGEPPDEKPVVVPKKTMKLKPEPSVCKKGVVTECEFWRAALRQTLRLDPLCTEDDPTFTYPWGADGNLRRLEIQYPGAKSCDAAIGDTITIRCYFPLRSPSESAKTRALALAESFNTCVSEEFATKMEVEGSEDAWLSVYLSPKSKESVGLSAVWQNQTPGGKAGTDQLKLFHFDAPWMKNGTKQAPAPPAALPKP